MLEKSHIETIKELKSAILASRYRVAVLANSEMLCLYFQVGQLISKKVKEEKWGSKVLEVLSADLQNELPILRGFSASNIKKMRIFYEFWNSYFSISSSATNQLKNIQNRSTTFCSIIKKQKFNQLRILNNKQIIVNCISNKYRVCYIC